MSHGIWVQRTLPMGYNCCNHYESADKEKMFLVIWMCGWSLMCLKTLWAMDSVASATYIGV